MPSWAFLPISLPICSSVLRQSLWVFLSLSISVSLPISLSICASVHLSHCLFDWLIVCLFGWLSGCLFVFLFCLLVCLYVCLFVCFCLSVCLSVCLFVLFVCLSHRFLEVDSQIQLSWLTDSGAHWWAWVQNRCLNSSAHVMLQLPPIAAINESVTQMKSPQRA